jgi:hypothetical protein
MPRWASALQSSMASVAKADKRDHVLAAAQEDDEAAGPRHV